MQLTRLPPCVFLACLTLAAQAAPALPGVGAAMQATVEAREVAGAVTLVATKDQVVHLEATGLANLEGKKPMAADAMFWIASTTKVTAAVAVLMLQDEGKLNVTDPVAKYLPQFGELKTPSGKPAGLTIVHLLTHTSGLAEGKRPVYFFSKTISEVIEAYFPAAPMLSEPGERWKYTTISFDAVARIVEIVSGKPYDAFLQERLLAPLGMKDTTFFPSETQQRRLAGNYARDRASGALNPGPLMIGTPVAGRFPPMAGAGLFSTAGDLGRFGQMLLNRGELEGKRYLSEASYKLLTTVHTGDLATGFSTGQVNKVLGWGLGTYVLRAPHAGVSASLSPGSFGHPGACGTSLIVDPVKGLVYVLMIQRPNLPDNFENETARAFVQAASSALAKSTP
jgi:CubicO group peptidase (beta-lactamase class C family)